MPWTCRTGLGSRVTVVQDLWFGVVHHSLNEFGGRIGFSSFSSAFTIALFVVTEVITACDIREVRWFRRDTRLTIDAFPYYCPGARRGNVFVATWLLRPRPRTTSIVLYARPTVTLRGFLFGLRSLIYFSDAEKTKMLCHDCCSVSHWTFVKKIKKKKSEKKVPRPFFLPANGTTTPSSVAGCLVRISGSTVVCSDRVTLWLSTVECCRRRARPGSFMAVILAGERAFGGK